MSIKGDVFLKPPEGVKTIESWKLRMTVYRLCDAPKKWYLNVKKELLATRCVKSIYDDAIFYWHIESMLQSVLCAHLDDFCWAGTDLFQKIVIDY